MGDASGGRSGSDEVQAAFERFWTVGCVEERWSDWVEQLTPDVEYVEHHFGDFRGRDQVRAWITELMVQRADVHALLDWYVIEGDRLVLSMRNRYYCPDPSGDHFDFPGMTALTYGGDGLFRRQEDYWCARGATASYLAFAEAVERVGGRGLEGGRLEALEAERRQANLDVLAAGRERYSATGTRQP